MGSALKISSSGQLGVAPSSARFKREIQSMDKASEGLLALRPVTFRYKPEIAARSFLMISTRARSSVKKGLFSARPGLEA